MWDPDTNETSVSTKVVVLDPADLDDGRCAASSYREYVRASGLGRVPRNPDYETWFGTGGYNRCVGPSGHANVLHKDEFGQVFQGEPGFKVVRVEEPQR